MRTHKTRFLHSFSHLVSKVVSLLCLFHLSIVYQAASQWQQTQFMIGSFWDPCLLQNETEDILRFQTARNAYLNFFSGTQDIGNVQHTYAGNDYGLYIAWRVAAKYLVQNDLFYNNDFDPIIANQVTDHFVGLDFGRRNAMLGYQLKDEPANNTYWNTRIKSWIYHFRTHDPSKLAYINLLPYYGWNFSNKGEYENYVDSYVADIEPLKTPQVVAFDYYPFDAGGNNLQYYYYNIGVIRSKAAARPFWIHPMSTDHLSYIDPQPEHLRFMVFSPLAYGAKGLIFFTYERPNSIDYRSAILDDCNILNQRYGWVQTINRFVTNIAGPIAMDCISLGAYHKSNSPTNENIPSDQRITSNTPLVFDVNDPNILVGIFREKTDLSTSYVLSVNKSLGSEPQPLTVSLKGDYRGYISSAPRVISYSGGVTYTSVTSVSFDPNTDNSVVTLPPLDGGEGFVVRLECLQSPSEINDIKVSGDRVFFAHNKGIVMVRKSTDERRYFNDWGANTPVVHIEVDGDRVYICQDNGQNGNFLATDLDLNYISGSLYNDGGLNTRVTSCTFSNDKIFIGQTSATDGNVVVLNKSDFSFHTAYLYGLGYRVADVKYQGDEHKSVVVAHQAGILRLWAVDNPWGPKTGHEGDIIGSYNDGANTPIKDMAVRTDALFATLDNGQNGGLVKLNPSLWPTLAVWNDQGARPRVLRLSLNGDKSELCASVLGTSSQSHKTFRTSDLQLNSSYPMNNPKTSCYDGNVAYLSSGRALLQVAAGLPATPKQRTSEDPTRPRVPGDLTFQLRQNYPNPFNPITTIQFTVPHEGFVSLKIFNLLGQEVATLLSEKKPAGDYTATWDATGVASGVYFLRMNSLDFVQSRKIIVQK